MPLRANSMPILPGWTVKRESTVPVWTLFGKSVFPELGYREFKQKLNGMLWERFTCCFSGQAQVLLKEDATVIRQRMDALFKSLVSMLKTALLKVKGRFDEEELRAVFAEHGMDVPSAKRFIGSLLESRTEEGAA